MKSFDSSSESELCLFQEVSLGPIVSTREAIIVFTFRVVALFKFILSHTS